jgi:hypothetical protein
VYWRVSRLRRSNIGVEIHCTELYRNVLLEESSSDHTTVDEKAPPTYHLCMNDAQMNCALISKSPFTAVLESLPLVVPRVSLRATSS